MKNSTNSAARDALRILYRKHPFATIATGLVVLALVLIATDVIPTGLYGGRTSLADLTDNLVERQIAPGQDEPSLPNPKTAAAEPLPPDVAPTLSAEAGEIRVADWNICWFPSGSPEPQDSITEAMTMRMAAKIIRRVEPTIFCAEEIRNEDIARQLAKEIKLPGFKLAVCSAFTNYDGTPALQQTAIFSTYPVIKTRCERWHTVNYIDPPRGYSFALLNAPGGPVGVFAIHLKSNYISQDNPNPEKTAVINRLKRQLASEQLIKLVDEWLSSGYVPANTRFIVAGDFNTAENERWKGETTLSGFRDAGWRSCYEGRRPEDCYTLPADPVFGYDAVTFDYIFTRGFSSQRALQIHPVSRRVSDHYLVTILLK